MFKLNIEDQSQIKLAEKLNTSETHLIKGLFGSGISLRIATISNKNYFLITDENDIDEWLNDAEQAAYFLNDLEHLSGEENILFFPSSKRKAYSQNNIDNSNVLQRSSVLKQISDKKQKIIVTYPEAIFEKIH